MVSVPTQNTEKTAPRSIWLIAGESSGDLYGAGIAAAMRKADPSLRIAGMGGPRMREAGVDILVDSSELGVVGVVEVLGSLFKFIRLLFSLTFRARKERPKAVVLIDYPGFNIRFARLLWHSGIPVIWYISPQVWAWRKSNIPKYVRYCRKMIVIFPFEQEFWANTGMDAEFAGHPLLDIVRQRTDPALRRDPKRVLILPGSRKNEVSRLLVPFMEAAAILKKRHPDWTFAVSAPREKTLHELEAILSDHRRRSSHDDWPEVELTCGKTAFWMQTASAAFAASGTVTVESAIAGLPLTVAYRLNPLTFLLARLIIRKLFRGFFTMVNIILDRCVFEEFLQYQVTPEALADSLEKIMPGGSRRDSVLQDMDDLRKALEPKSGSALERAARIILETAGL